MDVAVEQHGFHKNWLSRQVVRSCKTSKRSKSVDITLQEHYIRDDIPCGSPICSHGCRGPPSLPLDASHYLIPDASTIQHFWEILDFPQLTGVIFVSSVLKEAQTRFNGRQWRQLRSIFTDKRRGNLYFDDEHFIYTTRRQRRDSLHTNVEVVAQWFNEHLEQSIPIIILTGDMENSGKSDIDSLDKKFQGSLKITGESDHNFQVMYVSDYIKAYWRTDEMILNLCNSLVQAQLEWKQSQGNQRNTQGPSANAEIVFKKYLSETAIEEGLQDGSLHVGTFYCSRLPRSGGFVRPSNKGEASNLEVWIPAGKFQNRALHGDLVAVRIVSHDEEIGFGSESNNIFLTEDSADLSVDEDILENNEVEGLGMTEHEENIVAQKMAKLTGEIVGILQRIQRDYTACLEETNDISSSVSVRQEHVICVPMDRRIPMVRVKTRQRSLLVGNRFVIRIDGWDHDSKLPKGHVVKILGPIGDLETENRAILVENEINILPFTTLALQELPLDTDENPWCLPEKEYTCRRDLRTSHRTYSIDPPGSKDVDDCLSIRELDDGIIEVGVHIADVSFFVKEGSLLDLEAYARGTTVYMVGNTYHMLPSILSENLCSLRYDKDRLAVSVIWKVDVRNDYEILDIWFGRTIIHSRQQMFYAQAQAILDGKVLPDGWQIHGDIDELTQVRSDLCLLANFSQACKWLRESKGALELASEEIRFEIGENEEPLSVESKVQLPMNWIVAEMMIQANSYVARQIYESSGAHALLRRHPPPKQESFKFLSKCCEAQGLRLDASSNKALASSLDDIQESADPIVQNALKVLATRAMSEAEYIAAGDAFEPYNVSHYGLALEFYTHFTSPIRRYADIVVHRMLISSCERKDTRMENPSPAEVNTRVTTRVTDITLVADHLNKCHRASKRAQKECNQLHLLIYLEKNAQAEQGVVIEVQPQSLIVFVPKFDLRGTIHLLDKSGRVIMPSDDEKPINEGINVFHANQHKYSLKHLENSISVIDLVSGSVLYEYRKMASVWVQMRADGSRAHFPALQLHLLSNDHPVVRKSISENKKSFIDYTLPVKFKPQIKFQTDQISGENQQKDKKRSPSTTMPGNQVIEATSEEPVKMKPTLHDLLEELELRRQSTSSIYLDKTSPSLVKDSSSDEQTMGYTSHDTRMTAAIHSYTVINKEQIQVANLRKNWEKKLFEAAVYRSKQTRSRSSNNSVRVCSKHLKETEARHEAHLLHESMI